MQIDRRARFVARNAAVRFSHAKPRDRTPGREDRGVRVREAAGRKINQVFLGSRTMRKASEASIRPSGAGPREYARTQRPVSLPETI